MAVKPATTRALAVAAGLAVAALLGAGCTTPGPGGPGNPDMARVYGPGAYQLRGHGGGYAAELIVKQIKNGIVVLAAGGSYKTSSHLCAPGFSFSFYKHGRKQLTWAAPWGPDCSVKYTSGDHLVCLSSSHVSARNTPRTDLMGCAHPVFPAFTGTDVKLTAENKVTDLRYTVRSFGILLLPRSGARSEQ